MVGLAKKNRTCASLNEKCVDMYYDCSVCHKNSGDSFTRKETCGAKCERIGTQPVLRTSPAPSWAFVIEQSRTWAQVVSESPAAAVKQGARASPRVTPGNCFAAAPQYYAPGHVRRHQVRNQTRSRGPRAGRPEVAPAACGQGLGQISSLTFFLENIFDDTHTHLGHLTSPCQPFFKSSCRRPSRYPILSIHDILPVPDSHPSPRGTR